MADYQIVIIGGGPGGYEAALRAAELGINTALVERRDLGGTCLNRGCIPTKALLHTAEVYAQAGNGAELGLSVGRLSADMDLIFQRKTRISKTLRDGLAAQMEDAGIEIFTGSGTLCGDGHTVRVSAPGSTTEVTGEHIILASGSKPARPPIPGLEQEGVMTSDELLDGPASSFESLVIIGGGVIGVELATFYSELGCQVTILEGMAHLLPPMDKELGQNLAQLLKKRGVKVVTGAMVSGVTRQPEGLCVSYEQKGKTACVAGQKVLCAIGRVPETDGLLEEGLALEMDGRRIRVDARYQTSLPGVYAIGDVSARIQLAHAAVAQGRSCVEHLAGLEPLIDTTVIPSCVYCSPEVACVGMTADEAETKHIPAVTEKYVMFSNARTLIVAAGRSFIKVVAAKEDHRLLGVQLMCERASDIIAEFTQAITSGLTVEQMLRAVRAHPTFEEGVQEALRAALAKLADQGQ